MSTVKAALLSTLALASAEILLAPEDVPIECAAICGPVVELTRKCSLGMPIIEFEEETFARVKRRKVDGPGRGDGHFLSHRHVFDRTSRRKRAAVTNGFGQVVSVPSGLAGGQTFTVTTVVTVTAAPSHSSTPSDELGITTPPAEGPSLPTMSVMTTTMTMVVPDEENTPSDVTSEKPTDDTLEPTSTPPVVENGTDDAGRHENVETEGAEDAIGEAERECVCENKSFNVEKISGLCSSCIWQAGYMLGTMRSVMNQCKFSDGEYTPSSDSVVNDIRVDAERPTLPEGADTSLANVSPRSLRGSAGFNIALAVSVIWGIALMV